MWKGHTGQAWEEHPAGAPVHVNLSNSYMYV